MRPAEVDLLIGDATKAHEVLGWKPDGRLRGARRDDGRRRPRGPQGRAGDVTRALRHRHRRPGRQLPRRAAARRRRRGARPGAARPTPPAHCPPERRPCTSATSPTSTTTRRLVLDLAPDEVYNLAAISSVAQSWQEPDLVSRVNGIGRRSALLESARLLQERRPRRALRPGLQRRDLRRARPLAAGRGHPGPARSTRTAPRRPTRTSRSASTGSAACTPSSLVLYNHESPAAAARSS